MEWWQVMLILSIVVTVLSVAYSMSVGKDVDRGSERDDGVEAQVVKNKITANPIFWAFIVMITIVTIATVYFMFVYPEAAHRGGPQWSQQGRD